ncbi:MAG: acetyl-CoA C-acetyltransferase [Bdellovibrionales bacterium]|nr:acetyl-CoA C-acetyltransferase [Bdellovibrionales bacterium]
MVHDKNQPTTHSGNHSGKNVWIVGAKRTPVGSFQGELSSLPAPRLGAIAIQAALTQSGLKAEQIEECIMGQVLTAGAGQAPARQAAIYAGLTSSTPCTTINKVCGSGLKAVMLATDSIQLGHAETAIAGGQENMSLAPHLLENSRSGYKMGSIQATDSMIKDGLWDPYQNWHMGQAAEVCVREFQVSRQAQDEFAKNSYLKAQKAQSEGYFTDEIVPVEIHNKNQKTRVEKDEEPFRARFDKMLELKPAFEKEGTITAANASKINDGAAAVVLASDQAVKKYELTCLARIVSHATYAQDPKWFTTAPVEAIRRTLAKAHLNINEIDLFEINEAFSVVTMAAMKELNIPATKVNVHGGAVAIGHPIGASGARILTSLVYALKRHQKRYGLATLCIGGGEAVALIVERK